MKDSELFGLLKIPDEVVIKELRTEIGMLKSENDELKYRLSLAINPEVDKLVNTINSLKGELKVLRNRNLVQEKQKEINSLRNTNAELVYRLLKLKQNETNNSDSFSTTDNEL